MTRYRISAHLRDENGPKIPPDLDGYEVVGHTDEQPEPINIGIPCSCGETLHLPALVHPADVERVREWNENHNHTESENK